jgi:hypothetical protein
MSDTHAPIICDKCSAEFERGRGDFYVVRIEAFADPSPPNLSEEDLQRDSRREIRRLIEEMSGVSEQEALDQVHRRVTLYLCNGCYREWIEKPTGP